MLKTTRKAPAPAVVCAPGVERGRMRSWRWPGSTESLS